MLQGYLPILVFIAIAMAIGLLLLALGFLGALWIGIKQARQAGIEPSVSVNYGLSAQDAEVVVLPGVATPTEVMQALALDLAVVKLFPVPEVQRYGSIVFPSFETGVAFMYELAQTGHPPATAFENSFWNARAPRPLCAHLW